MYTGGSAVRMRYSVLGADYQLELVANQPTLAMLVGISIYLYLSIYLLTYLSISILYSFNYLCMYTDDSVVRMRYSVSGADYELELKAGLPTLAMLADFYLYSFYYLSTQLPISII